MLSRERKVKSDVKNKTVTINDIEQSERVGRLDYLIEYKLVRSS